MTKINKKAKDIRIDTVNKLAGGFGNVSAKQTNIEYLRRLTLATLLWENNAYVDGVSVTKQIADLIPLCDAKEVADLAVECRVNQKLRHIPLFLLCEMVKYPEHKNYVKDIIPKICTRVDMLTDLVSLYWNDIKKPLPASFKKGIAQAFLNFNEYSFAKYRGEGKQLKLKDIMFLCHPKPKTDIQKVLFKKIADNTLETPDTWEVSLSSGTDKKETWIRLINEQKLGGLAMLRNIRNMKSAEVPKEIISKGINDTKTAMLLPLDYLKTVRINPEFSRDIEDLMFRSYSNMPKLKGKSLIILDISGSMKQTISVKSDFTRMDAGIAMAISAINLCESYELVCTAGNDYSKQGKHEHIKYPKRGFDLFDQIHNLYKELGGGGIFTRQCIEWCKNHFKDKFDRIIVFSDSQDCDRTKELPKLQGKHNYIIDISSHKHGINYKGVWTAEISGWSEHFLTYISSLEGLNIQFEN